MALLTRPFALLALGLALTTNSGCISMYRMDIAQGNYVSQAQVEQLKAGMTREQVRFLMGTPLLIDPFRPDRWEYVFSFQQANATTRLLRSVTVLFDQDRVTKVEATTLPAKDDGSDPVLPKINLDNLTK
jgi:outer membrane protein assembly factor BamE